MIVSVPLQLLHSLGGILPLRKGNEGKASGLGDPKRYLPDPPSIYRYNECVRIALMAQNMTAPFVAEATLFDDLPAEVRFIEASSFVKGGSALRRFIVD